MLKDFRDFIMRGNVVDLAVGVIIGAAFGAVVKSLVDQVIMPPIGLATGGIDFAALKLVLKPADLAAKHAEVAILYGSFINTVITFLIVAFVIFVMVRVISKMRREQAAQPEPAPPAPTPTETLLTEIRDLLRRPAA
jgi:large conductance mechanosensitive channel